MYELPSFQVTNNEIWGKYHQQQVGISAQVGINSNTRRVQQQLGFKNNQQHVRTLYNLGFNNFNS